MWVGLVRYPQRMLTMMVYFHLCLPLFDSLFRRLSTVGERRGEQQSDLNSADFGIALPRGEGLPWKRQLRMRTTFASRHVM